MDSNIIIFVLYEEVFGRYKISWIKEEFELGRKEIFIKFGLDGIREDGLRSIFEVE